MTGQIENHKSKGPWDFAAPVLSPDAEKFQGMRGDGLLIDVTLNSNKLTLEFVFDENQNTSGREARITGSWRFEMKVKGIGSGRNAGWQILTLTKTKYKSDF